MSKSSSPQVKTNALAMLDKAICCRNKDFNLYVIDNVMTELLLQIVENDELLNEEQQIVRTQVLNCIEKWSTVNSSFAQVYKNLIDIGVKFPYIVKPKNSIKKTVSFCLLPSICDGLDSDSASEQGSNKKSSASKQKVIKLDDQKIKQINDIKTML